MGKKWLKFSLRLILYSIKGILLLTLALLLLFQIPAFRSPFLEHTLKEIEQKTDSRIQIKDISGLLPFYLNIESLSAKKGNVPWLKVGSAKAAIDPIGILRGRIALSFLEIEQLEIQSTSIKSSSSTSSEPIKKDSTFKLTTGIQIHHFAIHDLKMEQIPPCNLEGSLSISEDLRTISASLDYRELDKPHSPTAIHIQTRPHGSFITVKAKFKEAAHGSLTAKSDLFQTKTIQAQFDLQAPLTSWNQFLHLRNIETPLPDIQGQFQFNAMETSSTHWLTSILAKGQISIEKGSKIFLEGLQTQSILKDAKEELITNGKIQFNLDTGKVEGKFSNLPFEIPSNSMMNGTLVSETHISGSLNEPLLTLNLSDSRLTLLSDPLKFNTLMASSRLENGIRTGTVQASGNAFSQNHEFELNWKFNEALGLHIDHATLQSPWISAKGSFVLSDDETTATLSADVSTPPPALDFLHFQIGNKLSFSTHYKELKEKASFETIFEGADLTWENGSVAKLSGKSTLTYSDSRWTGPIDLSLNELNQESFYWKQATFHTELLQKGVSPFSFTAESKPEDEIKITAAGIWNGDPKEFKLTLNSMNAHLTDLNFRLQDPVTVEAEAGHFFLSPLRIETDQAFLETAFDASGEQVNGFLKAKQIPSSILRFVFPDLPPMRGSADLDISIRGTPKELEGDASLLLNQLQIGDKWSTMTPFDGKVTATIHPQSIRTHAEFISENHERINFDGSFPIHVMLEAPFYEAQKDQPIQGSLQADGEISPLSQFLLGAKAPFSGNATASLNATGTWSKPLIEGSIQLRDGIYESPETGAVFGQVKATIEGDGNTITLANISAQDGKGGFVTANGTVQILPKEHFPFDIHATINRAQLLHRDFATATASGSIDFTGNTVEGSIKGGLTLDQAQFTIPKDTPAELRTIDVVYINRPKQKKIAAAEIKQKEKYPISYHFSLDVPSNAYVNGRDLTSEWKGKVEFKGTNINPEVFGTLNIIRGTYMFNGKEFRSSSGSVTFSGDPRKTSMIYVVGERQIEDIRAQVVVKGSMDDPEVSFRSTPPLSEREILSWILFNRGPADITPHQGQQLRESVFTLSSGRSEDDPISKLRRTFGIDRVDIKSNEMDEGNEVSVRVGKYISQGLYVSVNRNITSEANQFGIEAQLRRNIKLEGEIGDNAEGKISLKWENDY